MGHSYIIGNKLEFMVRDSVCEAILGDLLTQLTNSEASQSTLDLVKHWYDDWHIMPPGTKELDMKNINPDNSMEVNNALHSLMPTYTDSEGKMRVAREIEAVLNEYNPD